MTNARAPDWYAEGPRAKIKASGWNGHLGYLRRRGLLEMLLPDLDLETRALVDENLPASAWVNSEYFGRLTEAIGARYGVETVRASTRAGMENSVAKILRPIVEGLSRVFGLTPDNFLAHVNLMLRATTQGIHATWTLDGRNTALVILESTADESAMSSEGWAEVFAFGLGLTSAKDVRVVVVERTPLSQSGTRVHFRCMWGTSPNDQASSLRYRK
jgi:hypothetical protein